MTQVQTNEQPTKMWSGRFREPLNPAFESWQRSFPFDVRLLTLSKGTEMPRLTSSTDKDHAS